MGEEPQEAKPEYNFLFSGCLDLLVSNFFSNNHDVSAA
jgi:hypothetical protein